MMRRFRDIPDKIKRETILSLRLTEYYHYTNIGFKVNFYPEKYSKAHGIVTKR